MKFVVKKTKKLDVHEVSLQQDGNEVDILVDGVKVVFFGHNGALYRFLLTDNTPFVAKNGDFIKVI